MRTKVEFANGSEAWNTFQSSGTIQGHSSKTNLCVASTPIKSNI